MKRTVLLLLCLCMIQAGIANAQQLPMLQQRNQMIQADIDSQRIPAGTIVRVRLEQPINTLNSEIGDLFYATIIEDIIMGNKIILPAGSGVRGTINTIRKSKRLSKCAELSLSFDHLITPVGRQIPVNVLLTNMPYITPEGTISAGTGYFDAMNKSFEKNTDLIANATEYGVDLGQSFGNGYPMVITVPVAAVGGTAYGTARFLGDSVMALFKKGDDVILGTGKILELTLIQPLDIPTN